MSTLPQKPSFLSFQTNPNRSKTNYLYEPVENKIASIQTQEAPSYHAPLYPTQQLA